MNDRFRQEVGKVADAVSFNTRAGAERGHELRELKCEARRIFSAVKELTYVLPCLRPAMVLCTPGACVQAQARLAMEGKEAHMAHDL